jgi:DNA polymerase-3 subunit epsilon
VYLELIGGRQVGLAFAGETDRAETQVAVRVPARPRPTPLPSRLDAATIAAHRVLLATLGSEPLWHYYDAA